MKIPNLEAMKSIHFIMACVIVAICGCTKNEVKTPAHILRAVCFNDPVIASMTKAHFGEMPDEYPDDETFGVFGVYHKNGFDGWESANAKNYINGAEFAYDPSVDDDDADYFGGWSGDYYFPHDGYLSFAAFSPFRVSSSATVSYGTDGLLIDDFSIPADPAEQYDLMYSKRIYDKSAESVNIDDPYEGLDIQFMHALSSIRFNLQQREEYPGVTLRLKSISISGVKYKGDFCENVENQTDASYSSSPSWDVDDALVDAPYHAYMQPDDNHLMLTSYYGSNSLLLDGDTDPSLNGQTQEGQNDLILMPQVFKDGSTVMNPDAEIEIIYTVQNGAGPKVPQKAVVQIAKITPKWEAGKRYIYNVSIGLNKIYFGPTVTGWTGITVDSITIE